MSSEFTAFNIGRDTSVQIILPTSFNVPLPFDVGNLGLLETFECNPVFNDIQVRAITLGGATAFRNSYSHWEGNFHIVRQTAAADYLMNVFQDAILAGGGQQYSQVIQAIDDSRGADTAQIKLTWSKSALKPLNAGSYSVDSPVTQAFEFRGVKRDISFSQGGASNSTTASLVALQAAFARAAA